MAPTRISASTVASEAKKGSRHRAELAGPSGTVVQANEGVGLRYGGALARRARPTPNPTRNPEKRRRGPGQVQQARIGERRGGGPCRATGDHCRETAWVNSGFGVRVPDGAPSSRISEGVSLVAGATAIVHPPGMRVPRTLDPAVMAALSCGHTIAGTRER
jgi:hypothetical protein